MTPCQELGRKDISWRTALLFLSFLSLIWCTETQGYTNSSSNIDDSSGGVLCTVGTHNATSVANMMATNMLFILDSTSKCNGLLRRACAVFAIPTNRTVLTNLEMFVTTYRTIKQDSGLSLMLELLTKPVLVRPSEVEFKDDGTAVVIVTLTDKDVVVVNQEDHIAIGLRSPEDTTIKSTNSHAAFQLTMSPANSPPESVPVRTREELAPFVWFEIGEDDGRSTSPPTEEPTGANNGSSSSSNPNQSTDPSPSEDASLMIGLVATIVAAILVVLACGVLFGTIVVKFYRRKRSEASMEEGNANDDSIRRPSAASIQSRNLMLQPKSGLHASSLPNITEELTWSFNGATGGVYVANTLPPPSVSSPTKPLPFPMPNYEMQSTMSTVVLSDKMETTRTKTTTMDSTVTEGPYDIPADGQLGTMRGSFHYSRTDYDDLVDRPYEVPPSKEDKICDYLRRKDLFRVERDDIKIVDYIGNGNFADIHKATWSKSKQEEECYVATKTLVSKALKDKVRFLQEAHIMSQFNHNNIVKIYRVLAEKKPVMIVLELLQGDLRNFLKDKGSLLAETCPDDLQTMFLRFSREIADGMKYLSRKGFIHRDLAARNVLTTEDLTCKISDFGLARDLSGDGIYQSQGGSIPVKWTAPEALHYGSYTSASDVWSFAVVLFEIWSLGKKPYLGLRNEHVLSFIESGQRLAPPPGCPKAIYTIMMDCWHPDPDPRPTFVQIEESLNKDDKSLLEIKPEDDLKDKRATVLGSNLLTGNYLYPSLQNRYLFYCEYNELHESPTS